MAKKKIHIIYAGPMFLNRAIPLCSLNSFISPMHRRVHLQLFQRQKIFRFLFFILSVFDEVINYLLLFFIFSQSLAFLQKTFHCTSQLKQSRKYRAVDRKYFVQCRITVTVRVKPGQSLSVFP